jgi:hypothetical protein
MKNRKIHKKKTFYYLQKGVKVVVEHPSKVETMLGFKLNSVKFIKEG